MNNKKVLIIVGILSLSLVVGLVFGGFRRKAPVGVPLSESEISENVQNAETEE